MVSTVRELMYFLNNGFDDILYAVPLGADKVPRVVQLHMDHPDQGIQVSEATSAQD